MTTPGVNVTTALRSGPGLTPAPIAGTAFLASPSPFGPLGPIEVGSLAEYLTNVAPPGLRGSGASGFVAFAVGLTGAAPAQIDQGIATVRSFFDEGGRRLILKRVVGADAVTANIVLLDADDDPGVTLNARTPGAWANELTVTVAAGTVSGRKVTIADGGLGLITDTIVLDNLGTNAAIAAAIAANAELDELLIATVGVGALIVVAAAAPLADGDDDNAGVELVGMAEFPIELGPGAIILPNLYAFGDAETIAANVKAVAEAAEAGRRIILTAPPVTPSSFVSTASNARDELIDLVGESRADELLGYIGAFWPGMVVPSIIDPDGSVAASIESYVAGVRARVIAGYGPHRAPAGEVSIARTVRALVAVEGGEVVDVLVGDAEVAEAAAAGLNPIRNLAGTIRIYGWSSLSGASAWASLAVRDVLNSVAYEADTRAEALVFRTIDPRGHLFAELAGILTGLGEELKAAGAVFPRYAGDGLTELDPGYSVDVGPEVNTAETIAAGQVNGVLAIRPAPNAATVNITITKVAVGGAI